MTDQEIMEAVNVAWLKKLREIYEHATSKFSPEQEALARNMFKLGFASGCEWLGSVEEVK